MPGWWVIAACGGSDGADVPTGALAPLEDNRASWPDPVDGDPFPEVLSTVSGGDSELWWAHGRGYLHTGLDRAWEAALDPEVGVDRREVDEWSVSREPPGELDASYVVHNLVRDVLTVEFDLWWRHELQQGEPDAPELVIATWTKTKGTPFIDVLEGSLVLRPGPEEGVVEVELVEHLKAALRDDETLVLFLEDFHASLLAAVHGRPLPVY
jgi:hypothetical protein